MKWGHKLLHHIGEGALSVRGKLIGFFLILYGTLTRDVIVSVIMATGVAVPLADKERLRRIVAAQEFL